jgi:hypothetical protein
VPKQLESEHMPANRMRRQPKPDDHLWGRAHQAAPSETRSSWALAPGNTNSWLGTGDSIPP